MKPGLLALSLLALLVAGCLQKETPPGEVPSSFYYKGKPVDPYCFMENIAQVGPSTVSLDVCTGKTKNPPAYNDTKFYGTILDELSGSLIQPYVYYKHLGQRDGNHVLQVIISGGGTGQFSDVRVVALNDNLMRTISTVAGGDRCNGGIYEASVDNGVVSYSQNITPADMLQLTGTNPRVRSRTGDEVQSCAACCVATADYRDGTLQTITLRRDPADIRTDELGARDTCFFNLYAETYRTVSRTLDADRMKNFSEGYNQRCVPNR